MKHFTPKRRSRNARTFIASLLSYLLIVGQVTPLALAAGGPGAPTGAAARAGDALAGKARELMAAPAAAPAAPAFAPGITASKVDNFDNTDGDGKVEPGQDINYEVTVANSGSDPATAVQFTDNIDANAALDTGSVTMSPLALNDTYSATKDTQLVVADADGVLDNDNGIPAPAATAIAAGPTTAGGTVTLNAGGGFTYDPPPGFVGADTFTYTATNTSPETDTATVTINVDARPVVTDTTPDDNATQVANNANVVITFSEPVDVTGEWFSISCPTSGNRNVAATAVTPNGTNDVYTINPNADFANGETCTVTVVAAQVADQDANDPPDNPAADFVFDFTIDTPPAVSSTSPSNGDANVAGNANITVTFDEAVTAAAGAFAISCTVSGAHTASVTPDGTNTVFTLNPDTDFVSGETCTVTVNDANVTDNDTGDPPDNMAADYVFSFSIDAAPTVTNTTPADNATNQAGNVDIVITFSEPVDVTGTWFTIDCTTTADRTPANSVVTPNGTNTVFTINPNDDFAGGETCTVTVNAAQVADQDTNDPPNTMAANHVFDFSIDTGPTVTNTTPADNATNQANNVNVVVTFDEPVDVTGEWFGVVCALSGTHDVADYTVTPNGTNTVFTLAKNTAYTNGETCTVTINAANVTDQDGNDPPDAMSANYVFDFKIDLPPIVLSTSPANGDGGANDVVAPNTNITVTFDEPVNATTSSFKIECPTGTNIAYTLSASPATVFTLDPTADLPIGTICTVTVVAAQVTDADAGDPPDNPEADYVFSFKVPPQANPDARDATGNVRIQTAGRSGFSLLTNDIGPGIAAVVASGLSTHGGQYSVAADGTFSYNPPAGFTGTDTFPYTISNVAGTDIGTVTITVTGMIWFINNQGVSCVAAGCGRLTTPFTTLQAFESFNGNGTMNPPLNDAVVSPEAGDHIFIYTGSGNYVGPLTLENNQRVVGQGATSPAFGAGSLTGIVPATDSDTLPSTGGTKPTITSTPTSGTNGITLANGDSVYGVAFSNTEGAAIRGAVNVGTLTMADIVINNTGGRGIHLSGGGTATLTGAANTITTTTGVGVDIANTTIGAANFTLLSLNRNGGSATAINLSNTGTGTFNVTGTGTTANSGGIIDNVTGADAVRLDNTDGRVTLKNMTIEDISSAGDASDAFHTRSGVDAIHGQLVDGGLTLDNVTIRRISDSAINGTTFGNLNGITSWVGLVLNNCTLENTNRFHVANRGDETEEGIVRIRGLSGTVNVQNTEFENGARGMDIFTPNTGSLDITVQASEFLNMSKDITGQATNRVGVWGFYLRGMGSATAVARIGDPAETNSALGNTFLNNGAASIVIEQDSSAVTGSIIASVSRNTFTVTDHLSADETGSNGSFDADFPQGGVLFRPFGGTIEAIFAANTFNDAMHANGAVGQLGLIADTGSDSEFIVRNNTFNGPWDFITEIRADGNTSCAMLWQNNSFPSKTLGPAEIAGTELADIGLATQPLPFEPYFVDVRNNGQLDLTIQNETIPAHDPAATSTNSFMIRTQATGGTLDLEMDNNKAARGYRFNQNGASIFNLFRDGSAQATPQLVLRDNGNRGGGGNVNTDPPVVNQSGVVILSVTDPTMPSVTIPPQPAGPAVFAESFEEGGDGASAKSQAAFDAQAEAGVPVIYNTGPVQHSAEDLNIWAMRRMPRGSTAPDRLLFKRGEAQLDRSNPPAGAGAAGATPTATAPAATTPAPTGRVWSDMPAVIIPAPRVNPAPEAEKDGEAEDADAEQDDAAKESDSAEPEKKPARKKGRVTRTETYRPKDADRQTQPEQSQPEPAQPEQPEFRNISYTGPLGAAPSRAPRFTRASFAPSGDRAVKTAGAAKAAPRSAKAAARTAPLAAAAACSPSATQVCVDIGTLPAGKSVVIRFKVTVDNPFTGVQDQVSNQGSVSYAESMTPVQTDDPSEPGANDPTVTPVAAPPDIVVHDASVPEPKSGSTNMTFTITLSRNPPADVTVHFTTEDEPAGPGKAEAGSDYTATSGSHTFTAGQRVFTVSVPVLHDNAAEPAETFKLKLTSATGGNITDGEATGTITPVATPGAVLISEVRTSGPGGLGDDFVEIYNNSDTPATVPAGGWGLFKKGSDCDATPVLIGTVPAGTIPARAHFLFVGSEYSLADYGGTGAAAGDATLTEDIETDHNVALFSTTDVAQLSSQTKLDGVGFGINNQGNCNLLREGNILGGAPAPSPGPTPEYSYFRKLCGFVNGVGCQTDGTPLDTQDNANDFTFADTAGTPVAGTGQRLGAPGPENSDSPVQTNLMIVALLDSSAGGPAPPNRVRNTGDNPQPGITDAGTMSIRRRVINNTGAPVSRLRFRISEMTTYPPGPGQADLRALTGSPVSMVSITNDSATCGGPPSCSVTVQATTLEQPPTQSSAGGGLNSTLTVTLGTPLAHGDHVLVHFYLGVKQPGLFRFYIVTETLP